MKKNVIELTLEDQALLTYFSSLGIYNKFDLCLEEEEMNLKMQPGSLESKIKRLIEIQELVETETYVDDTTDQTISSFSLSDKEDKISRFDLPLGVILCKVYSWEDRLDLLETRARCIEAFDKFESIEFLYNLAKLSEEALKFAQGRIVYYDKELRRSYGLQDQMGVEMNELESKIRQQKLRIISLENLFHPNAPDVSEQTLTLSKTSTKILVK